MDAAHDLRNMQENKGRQVTDTPDQIAEIFVDVLAKVREKEKAYGGSWRRRGWRGNLIRLLTKGDRLERMLWRTARYSDEEETVEDTALDQIALLAMFVINYRAGNEWGPRGAGGTGTAEGSDV